LRIARGSLVVSVLLVAGTARAHPLVDEARASYENADFEGALDALSRAEASTELVLADLEALYDLRILVHLGMGDDEAVEADLRRLLSIAPAHEFGDATPPEVLEQASQVRTELGGPIRVVARAAPGTAGVRIEAEVRNDPSNVTRSVRIGVRRGGGVWRVVADTSTDVASGEAVEFYAEAVGPGGVVLATDGTRSGPRVWDGGASSGGVPWLWVGVGAGAVALIAVVVVVVATSGGGESERSQPSLPMVSFE
jgi:hypothetical protein